MGTRREIVLAAWEVAREKGLATFTLKDVAVRVGMQAPSLYSHFSSKNAIYDAMFEQAWSDYEQYVSDAMAGLPSEPRELAFARLTLFFDFATADLPRYQLMNQRTIPGFEPSEEAFAPSQRAVGRDVEELAKVGVPDRGDVEILFAIVAGLADQQLANDPGGDSRRVLLRRAFDMWADGVGLPPTRTRRTKK